MTPRRAVLIGLGMVADTHALALRDASGAKLHGVWARSTDKARAFAARHGGPRVYGSLDDIAGDTDLDFAIVLKRKKNTSMS